jgi:hypothetical protein
LIKASFLAAWKPHKDIFQESHYFHFVPADIFAYFGQATKGLTASPLYVIKLTDFTLLYLIIIYFGVAQ